MTKSEVNIQNNQKINSYQLKMLVKERLKMQSLTCLVKKEGNQYASLCVELDIASCGNTKKEAVQGLKNAIETYLEYMISEKRENEIYRPVPMNELKNFLFPNHTIYEQPIKAIPLEFEYA